MQPKRKQIARVVVGPWASGCTQEKGWPKMSTLSFDVQLQLLATEAGGKANSIRSGYTPSWKLGNQPLGESILNDGRILLDAGEALAPGHTGLARLVPLAPEYWSEVCVGTVIAMLEGSHVVGHATILAFVA